MTNTRHSSDSDAWFTPHEIIEAARATMGGIDLDPASCAQANEHVRAQAFYDKESNGFTHPWYGKVFLNPPGGHCDADGLRVVRGKKGQPGCEATGACGLPRGHAHRGPVQSAAKAWWARLAAQWLDTIDCAVFVGFSIEILQTTQIDLPPPSAAAGLLCFPKKRLSFLQETDKGLVPIKGNTHASVIVALGPDGPDGDAFNQRFIESFSPIGKVRL